MDEVSMRLEKIIGRELTQHSLSLCTAESCTGGLVAGRITNVSGASGCFEGGFITYSNSAKSRLIGVPEELIERYRGGKRRNRPRNGRRRPGKTPYGYVRRCYRYRRANGRHTR